MFIIHWIIESIWKFLKFKNCSIFYGIKVWQLLVNILHRSNLYWISLFHLNMSIFRHETRRRGVLLLIDSLSFYTYVHKYFICFYCVCVKQQAVMAEQSRRTRINCGVCTVHRHVKTRKHTLHALYGKAYKHILLEHLLYFRKNKFFFIQ